MPCIPMNISGTRCILHVGDDYEVGSQPPEGYNEWHEWATVQHFKGGLRQSLCSRCRLWKYPQEKCCDAPRTSYAEWKRELAKAEKAIKAHAKASDAKYRREVREARKRGELKD